MTKRTAIYVRVSTVDQNLENQLPDLKRWAHANGVGVPSDDGWLERLAPRHVEQATWFADKFTGQTTNRPGWKRLMALFDEGKLERIVVWRLDRLARRASGMTALFDRCIDQGVSLISMRESFDLSTPSGRLFATMLAGFAQFECESLKERLAAKLAVDRKRQSDVHELAAHGLTVEQIVVRLGIRSTKRQSAPELVRLMLAKPAGVLWYGGRKPGDGRKETCSPDRVRALLDRGLKVSEVAAATGVARRTVYRRLKELEQGRAFTSTTGGVSPQAT